MDRNQVRWSLFKLALVVLSGTTWVFFSFVMQSRPEEPLTLELTPSEALHTLVRLPASLPMQLPHALPLGVIFTPQIKGPPVVEMNVMNLPCWDKSGGDGHEVSARWIRFTGKTCQKGIDPERVSVRNLTNGYTGTVFEAKAKALTTDYIPLEQGPNEISVRFERGPGAAFETQFVLTRR